jgi:hypothetical protein
VATATSEHKGATEEGSWFPTRKWWTALIAGVGALLVTGVSTGDWSRELAGAAIGLVVQLLLAYLTPNQATPGGVPQKSGPRL